MLQYNVFIKISAEVLTTKDFFSCMGYVVSNGRLICEVYNGCDSMQSSHILRYHLTKRALLQELRKSRKSSKFSDLLAKIRIGDFLHTNHQTQPLDSDVLSMITTPHYHSFSSRSTI
jgi:hypothetical protein